MCRFQLRLNIEETVDATTMFSKLRHSFRRKSRARNNQLNGDTSGVENTEYGCRTFGSAQLSAGSVSSLHSGFTDNNGIRSDAGSTASLWNDVSSTSTLRSHVKKRSSLRADRYLLTDPDTQWQKETPSVVESNRIMFNRQLQCDVTFVVGDDASLVSAHRYVLVARSDVFTKMFLGPLADAGPVVIPDVTETVFRHFLQFLYVDEVPLTPENVTSLHYLGRKYDVEPLVQRCLEFLHARLTCENACSIVEQAHCFEEHELYQAAFDFLTNNVHGCLSAAPSSVHDLCRACLQRLLSLDVLEAGESLLFQASLSWAEASLERRSLTLDAYNVRQELGPLLSLIRFPAMTLTTLRERVFPTGVLTLEEVKGLVTYKEKGSSGGSALPFTLHGRQRIVHRFQNTSQLVTSVQDEEPGWTAAITFSCDRDFNLHGIQVYSCSRETQRAEVRFSVLHGQEELDAYNHSVIDHSSNDFPHTYTLAGHVDGVKTLVITISSPLQLKAKVDHTLVVTATNLSHCFVGTGGTACVTLDDCASGDDITFRFRDAAIAGNSSTVGDGQIPCLIVSGR